MKCANCGAEIKEGEKFCTKCGTAVSEKAEVLQNNNLNEPGSQRRKSHAGLIAGIFALVLIAIFSIIVVLGVKTDEEQPTNNEESSAESINNNEADKTKQPTTTIFNGYTFTIPADCKASASGNQLFVYGPGSKWVGVVMMQEGSYDTLVTMKDQIKAALSAQEGAENYDMSNAITEEKTYGGKPFLITKNIKSGTYNLDISYGKADDNNIYVVSITKSNGTELTESERIEMYSVVASGQKNA